MPLSTQNSVKCVKFLSLQKLGWRFETKNRKLGMNLLFCFFFIVNHFFSWFIFIYFLFKNVDVASVWTLFASSVPFDLVTTESFEKSEEEEEEWNCGGVHGRHDDDDDDVDEGNDDDKDDENGDDFFWFHWFIAPLHEEWDNLKEYLRIVIVSCIQYMYVFYCSLTAIQWTI